MSTDILKTEYYTVPNAAYEIGIHKTTLYNWIHEGRVVTIEVGGILFISKDEVERLKDS